MLSSNVPDCKPFVRSCGHCISDDYNDIPAGYFDGITYFPLSRDQVPSFGHFGNFLMFLGRSNLEIDLPLVVRTHIPHPF